MWNYMLLLYDYDCMPNKANFQLQSIFGWNWVCEWQCCPFASHKIIDAIWKLEPTHTWGHIYCALSICQTFLFLLCNVPTCKDSICCVCGCRPSCHWFVAGFGYLTVQGRCCRNLQLTLLCSFVAGEDIAKIILHRPWLITLQDSKVRHPTPLFPYLVRISRNLARRLPFERDTVVNMQIFAYL